MRSQLFILVLVWFVALQVTAEPSLLPSPEQMKVLRPEQTPRLQTYDSIFRSSAAPGRAAQARYSDPAILSDVDARLRRVERSGDYSNVLSPSEKRRFAENLAKLRDLEMGLFEKASWSSSMNAGVHTQKLLTGRLSPEPRGAKRAELIAFWKRNAANSPLYSDWHAVVPGSDLRWSDVFERFVSDPKFRNEWIQKRPDTLVKLKQMSSIRSWDDTSVRTVQVFDAGLSSEYWILHFDRAHSGPNRFRDIVEGNFDRLLKNEFAPTLEFNRLSRIESAEIEGQTIDVYHLVAVKKGRTMEPASSFYANGSDKKLYPGARLLRSTKLDEFEQRQLIQTSLSLFIGPRAMSLYEAQMLNAKYPVLTKAVGQFGFSLTGGLAQTTSRRTDGVDKQALKLTATLIDIIDFANTEDVDAWFKANIRQVLRTIVGGVGAGGESGNYEPGRTNALPHAFSSRSVEKCNAFGGVTNVLQRLISR